VLFGENKPGARDLSYGKRSWIIDHERVDRVPGLITVIGVRYTTARGVAEQAVDLALKRMDRSAAPSRTATTPIYGGDYETFDGMMREATSAGEYGLPEELALPLLRNYGSRYRDVLRHGNGSLPEPVGTSTALRAEVFHALREEMAVKLGDIVFRRTDLATGACPDEASLEWCAGVMAAELGWDRARVEAEIREVRSRFR
jgi:glycerol-3-phosphate dehydrogenase